MIASAKSLLHGTRFGRLVVMEGGEFRWRDDIKLICDCGKVTTKKVGSLINGRVKSCGRCLEISAEEMSIRKFGKLRMKYPHAVTSGSAKKVTWVCDCGKESDICVFDVVNKNRSCDRCTNILISEIYDKKFGKLCLVDAVGITSIPPHSHKKLTWMCDCGKTKEIQARYVFNGVIHSCGKCNEVLADEVIARKFGRMRLRDPQVLKSGSNKKVWWICDCGRENLAQVVAVMSGRTRSCGRCHISFKQRYEIEKEEIRKLKTPISPDTLPDWCPEALEVITNTSKPFRAKCRLCSNEYFPCWSSIRLGKSLTCGCSVSRVSNGQKEIHDFIISLGKDARLEYKIGELDYDIWVPENNLAIEFNGLKWHSRKNSKKRDTEKYNNVIKHGCKYLMIYEDEWIFKRCQIKNVIKNRLSLNYPKSVRPQKCDMKTINHKEADAFYDLHHYIGQAKSPVNYGVFYEGELIACCSFKRPTRQSSHDWELVRMAANPEFRIHGIWSKIIKKFISEYKPISIVSFSDNRLFAGDVYTKIGFKLDGKVRADYYWVKGNKRHHKSKLRKTDIEKASGKTETELRRTQGYSKIWDLGKMRWVL